MPKVCNNNINPIAKGCLSWENTKVNIIKPMFIIDCKINQIVV